MLRVSKISADSNVIMRKLYAVFSLHIQADELAVLNDSINLTPALSSNCHFRSNLARVERRIVGDGLQIVGDF
jgi:hypothetical protein